MRSILKLRWQLLVLYSTVLLVPRGVNAQEFDPNSTPDQPGLVKQQFIYTEVDFPQCHASTIEETPHGLVAAWFGGTHERNDDVGIWISRNTGDGWSPPVEVADGVEDGRDYPCWNPVLFQPAAGPLLLFYKVGPTPRDWWGRLIRSDDGGKSWVDDERLPDGILGPIKNKPIALADGSILCGSSTEHDGWRVHMERTPDLGRTWHVTGPLNHREEMGAIQPAIIGHDANLRILCRSQQGKIATAKSTDAGRSWSAMTLMDLPNPNSGLDAVTLDDGSALMVYNHIPRGRHKLHIAVAPDGETWHAALVLEDQRGEFSYPAVIQADDGLVHVTYTFQRRRVKHVVVDPKQLKLREFVNGEWP